MPKTCWLSGLNITAAWSLLPLNDVDTYPKQSLWKAAHRLFGEGNPLAEAFGAELKEDLWKGQIEAIADRVEAERTQRNIRGVEAIEELKRAMQYLRDRAPALQYQTFQDRGDPTGSGPAEAGGQGRRAKPDEAVRHELERRGGGPHARPSGSVLRTFARPSMTPHLDTRPLLEGCGSKFCTGPERQAPPRRPEIDGETEAALGRKSDDPHSPTPPA